MQIETSELQDKLLSMLKQFHEVCVENNLVYYMGGGTMLGAATPDGILVTDKNTSDKLKNYVSDQRPMYEKRAWGEYQVLDYRIQEP